MKTPLSIRFEMLPSHAFALQQNLREQLRMGIQEHWYSDEFRLIANGLRMGAILAKYPALAAQKKTLGALQAAMNEQA